MPIDPQTGKYQDVALSSPPPQFSQGRNLPPAPEKALATASKRLVAETQMRMRPEVSPSGQVSATPGGAPQAKDSR